MAASPWWHGAVLYHLYVRSWQDSNGDGYGDLRGITGRLDHLAWLGADGIWLSPTMPSPDADWGYDVADYTGVHPDFGTLEDLDELIAAAGRLGIRVLLDLVPNHTSSAHPWFADATSSRESSHRDYYVWADERPGGGLPNNWLDSTGQPAWQWHAPTGQYYLHNYLPEQPDLNWWQPAVHDEFGRILRFWFDRGVAGVRIDVANGLYKDAEHRDNPPLPASSGPLDGRFGYLRRYSANRPETHAVYRDWRKIADSYQPPRLLLGETWVSADHLAAYYGTDDELQLCFNFPFAFVPFALPGLASAVTATLATLPAGACPVWMASNHDIGRFSTRWCGGDRQAIRLALLILATLPGTIVLYYGDEIGMTDVPVPPGLQRDRMTLGPAGTSRDRARTPMRWDDSAGGGFSIAPPWLPIGPAGVNVADERADPGSELELCRRLLTLRRAELRGLPALVTLPAPDQVWAYRTGSLVVAANFGAEPHELPREAGEVLLRTGPGNPPDLAPAEGLVARAR